MKKMITYIIGVVAAFIVSIAIYSRSQPKHVSAQIFINAPTDQVWALWSKFDNVADFVPMVHESHTVGDITEGLGQARRCNIQPGVYVEERITAWEPGKAYAMEVYQSAGVMIDQMLVDYQVKPSGTGTLALVHMSYQMQGLAEFLPVYDLMKKQAIDQLVGIKHLSETGEKITAELLEILKKKYFSDYRILP
ncbi:SRPBCC family protein [Reichenbachiella sp.]|uniref:SRPBCC family protein n=1 Tax=Reichenbachiella sp. TaxID=2184521 RepID=UPI003B5AAC08